MHAFKLFLSLCLIAVLATSVASNGLENFLRLKLAEYPAWIKENNYDPSPLVTGPTKVTASNLFANIDCYLSNHGIQGLSSSNVFVNSTSADLKSGEISVSFATQGDLTFSGKYMATGKLLSTTPISGDGTWSIKVPEIHFLNLKIKWNISPSGHLSIFSNTFTGVTLPGSGYEVNFDNIWKDSAVSGYKQVIQEAIYVAFQEHLVKDSEHPVRKMLLEYFLDIFAETPLAEIIAVTMPPTTTETTPTTKISESPTRPTQSTLPPFDNDEAEEGEGWQLSKTMTVMLFLWLVAIILIVIMFVFVTRLFLKQRHNVRYLMPQTLENGHLSMPSEQHPQKV